MKTFKFSFIGRITGASGIVYKISDTYKANSLGEAIYMLHTDYDSVVGIKCNGESLGTDYQSIKCEVPKRKRDLNGNYIDKK